MSCCLLQLYLSGPLEIAFYGFDFSQYIHGDISGNQSEKTIEKLGVLKAKSSDCLAWRGKR